jgi:hypothetical protein
VPTGNATFDERFRVVGLDLLGGASGLVTPEMQQLILTRADWAFAAHETTLLSIAKDAFETPEGMGQRIIETLAIVAAFPTSVVPAQVDHSVDDLLTRIDQLDSIDEGIAFLQNLSDADRTRLAQSPSPLARFAQVRTPEEAMSLFMSLPETDRLQILAMFSKATGN